MRVRDALYLLAALALVPAGALHAKDKAPLKVANAKAMSGLSRMVVANFSVAFVTDKTDAAFAGSRRNGKAMGAITKARLAGVAPVDFQAVTDAAYADFATRMTAAGYTLADRATMVADRHMAKATYLASGWESTVFFGKDSKAKAVFYGPTVFGPTPLLKGEMGEANAAATGGGMFSAFKGLSSFGNATAKVMYVTQNGQPIVSVLYVVDFADVERYGGYYAYEAKVGLTASLAVVETLSAVTTTNAKGAIGTVTVAQPVAVPGDFGTMQDSTTGGQKLDNVAGAVIGGLFGSGSNTYKHITFTADPGSYRTGAIAATSAANGLVVAELAAHR